MTTKLKDPDAVKDYVFDFGREMTRTSDTISTIVSVAVSPSGLTIGAGSPPPPVVVAGTDKNGASVASAGVRFWVSGGTLGTEYAVTCRITTVGGRTLDYTGYIRCVSA